MLYILITILFLLAFANLALLYLLIRKLRPSEKPEEKPAEKQVAQQTAAELDNKATNAERLYLEGVQSILSYDVNTMKQFLKGAEEE